MAAWILFYTTQSSMGHGDQAGLSSQTALGLMIYYPQLAVNNRLTTPELLPDPKPKPGESKLRPPSAIAESLEYNETPLSQSAGASGRTKDHELRPIEGRKAPA